MTEEIDEPVETIEKHLHDYEEVMVKMEQKAKNCEFKVCRCAETLGHLQQRHVRTERVACVASDASTMHA